ncbi:hypothetical protein GX48_02517 [Paracoccidioides brasiliensis]|nr:hypothetical protein GX48_02517 [Paracoccidioides brasiliensis]
MGGGNYATDPAVRRAVLMERVKWEQQQQQQRQRQRQRQQRQRQQQQQQQRTAKKTRSTGQTDLDSNLCTECVRG